MVYFAHGSAAARYARWRPEVHPEFVVRLAKLGVLDVAVAVDAGCGTGQSTRALAAAVPRVVGVDPAAEMLTEAAGHPRVRYVRAAAEALPLWAGCAGLVTAALAFHWFDASGFAAEALRVLLPGGHLAVCDSWFTAEVDDGPGFREWFTTEHLDRYPSPPRNRQPLDGEFASTHGFVLVTDERFTQQVAMTPDQLGGYLLTQTNVIAAVEEGVETIDEAAAWVEDATGRHLGGRHEAHFTFGGRIVCLRKPAAP